MRWRTRRESLTAQLSAVCADQASAANQLLPAEMFHNGTYGPRTGRLLVQPLRKLEKWPIIHQESVCQKKDKCTKSARGAAVAGLLLCYRRFAPAP
jgi:hypothetical protein